MPIAWASESARPVIPGDPGAFILRNSSKNPIAWPMKIFMVFAYLIFFLMPSSRACTIGSERIRGIDLDEYILYGRVVGYGFRDFPGRPAWGLILEVVDPIHVPAKNVKLVEIYKYFINSPDCHTSGISEKDAKLVPIGTVFGIAAKPFPGPPTNPIQLDITMGGFKSFPFGSDVSALHLQKMDWSMDEGMQRDDFELKKDIARLDNSSSAEETLATLKRLNEMNPYSDFERFPELVKRHVKDPSTTNYLKYLFSSKWKLPDDFADDLFSDSVQPN